MNEPKALKLTAFYRCRWCQLVYQNKHVLDTKDARYFVSEVGAAEGVTYIEGGSSARMPWLLAVHDCDGKGRAGLADFIGARPTKVGE